MAGGSWSRAIRTGGSSTIWKRIDVSCAASRPSILAASKWGNSAQFGGRTPWSARVPQDPLPPFENQHIARTVGRRGRRRAERLLRRRPSLTLFNHHEGDV